MRLAPTRSCSGRVRSTTVAYTHLDVYKRQLERFELDVASGDYTVEGLTCQTAKLGVASGTVEVADVVVQNLKADIASGHVALAGDLAEAFDLKIASGDVSISTRQCPKTCLLYTSPRLVTLPACLIRTEAISDAMTTEAFPV